MSVEAAAQASNEEKIQHWAPVQVLFTLTSTEEVGTSPLTCSLTEAESYFHGRLNAHLEAGCTEFPLGDRTGQIRIHHITSTSAKGITHAWLAGQSKLKLRAV